MINNQFITLYSQAHHVEFLKQIEHAIFQKQFKKSTDITLIPQTFNFDKITSKVTGYFRVIYSLENVYIFINNYLNFEPMLMLLFNQDRKKIF